MESRALQPMQMSQNQAENWKNWIQKFRNYLVATETNKKPEEVQCAQLIYYIGDEGLQIYNSFEFTATEKNCIESLIKKFENHFVPKKNVDFERYKFFTMRQMSSETTDQFVTKLKAAAKQCEFDKLEDELVKSMLTIGIGNEKLREKLLQNSDLKLEKAVELCIISENTKVQTEIMKAGKVQVQTSAVVDVVNRPRQVQMAQHQQALPDNSHQQTRSQGNRNRRFANTGKGTVIRNCLRCGRTHGKNKCPAFKQTCNYCKKLNHFASQCTSKHNSIHVIDKCDDNDDTDINIDTIVMNKKGLVNWTVDLQINETEINFKIDTGSSVNIITDKQLKETKVSPKIKKSVANLISYTNNKIPTIGLTNLQIQYKNKKYDFEFHVVKGDHRAILGLRSSVELNLIEKINSVTRVETSTKGITQEEIIKKNHDVFCGTGKLSKPYHIELFENAVPVAHPIRKVPFAIEKQLKETLAQMMKQNIIEPAQGSADWVNPLVIVKKGDGSLRICLDPLELNKYIKREYYKLPTIDELMINLNGATHFSILDATSGFWNVPLDAESSKLCTFGTPYGRYRFLRMPYGLKSAPEVFQQRFQNIFNAEGVVIYIDDILVWGKTEEEHNRRLENVFKVARANNVKFNFKKCKFGLTEVRYVGHKFSASGISMDEKKIEAIKELPVPENKKDAQRFLGLVTYVGRFIPNLSEKTKPIRDLIKNDITFQWNTEQQCAFENIKEEIIKDITLQYFNPEAEITMSVDASQNGLGAVLMQQNKPCAYASRSMTDTQKRYAQIEKELLAICFGVQKFHQYVYGKKFRVETDHKPLITIFKKPLNACPARLQRMLLSLQKYETEVVYKPGKELIVADALSRATSPKVYHDNLELEEQVCLIAENLMITQERLDQLKNLTNEDETLQHVTKFIRGKWPKNSEGLTGEMKTYYKIRHDIIEGRDRLIYNGQKVVIPKKMRNLILEKIHTGHQGIKKCQQRANEVIYWPGMYRDIDMFISACRTCQKYTKSNQPEPLAPHQIPRTPWLKVGVDIFEHENIKYLLIVDYYSKFVEVENLRTDMTTENVINKLKKVFSTHGIPLTLISDGGPQFTSKIFKNFANDWNFDHIVVSPHYQQSNGMAERAIQTVKKIIKKSKETKQDVD